MHNVETEARTYCSSGGSSIGVPWQNILGDGVAKKFCLGWQKNVGMRWQNYLGVEWQSFDMSSPKKICHPMTKKNCHPHLKIVLLLNSQKNFWHPTPNFFPVPLAAAPPPQQYVLGSVSTFYT